MILEVKYSNFFYIVNPTNVDPREVDEDGFYYVFTLEQESSF